jgi:hypothetical protein
VAFLQTRRRDLARTFSVPPLAWSQAASLLWESVDNLLNRRISLLRIDISMGEIDLRNRKGFREQGPLRRYANDDERYRDLTAVWERSIRMMADVAEGAGMSAFFFLQPNQRVPGSKTFSPEEKEIAFPEGYAYDRPARQGYPLLIEGGKRLASEGVAFEDLTMLFEGEAASIYNDGCCHVNERGSRLIAQAMTRFILDWLASRDGCEAAESP